jgi:hypothetical protein
MSNITRPGPSGSKPPPQEPLFGRDRLSRDRKIVDCSEAEPRFGYLKTNQKNDNQLPYLRCYTDFSCPDKYEPKLVKVQGQSFNGDSCRIIQSEREPGMPTSKTPICPDGKVLVSLTSNQKVCVKPIVTPSK